METMEIVKKPPEEVVSDVVEALEENDYTFVHRLMLQYDYSFKKRVEQKLPAHMKKIFCVICP